MTAVTRGLAEFVQQAPSGVASPRASIVLKHAFLDLAGCIVAGADEDAGRLALDYALSQAAPGPATVIGSAGHRLAPSLAALANGTAGHALDFDDIGVGAGHVSVAILPAVLAVGELVGADGSSLLDALVLGYEVAHRLTTMYSDTRLGPYAAGYHKPSVYSLFGATAGAGRLLGLSSDELSNALGIAASEAGGLRANFGTMTKPLHAGLSNRAAVEATLLAASGFTASTEALEQRFGWHDVICRGEGDLDVVLDGLGSSFAIEEGLVFKAYPSCGANHYAIDAILSLMRDERLTVEQVASIEVGVETRNLEEVLVYPWPRTPLEGKFSLAYNCAAALADGAVTVDTFTDEALTRLTGIRERVRVRSSAQLPQNGAHVALRTHDGRRFDREQLVLRGSLADPMTWGDLAAKFLANVDGRLDPDSALSALTLIAELEEQSSLKPLGEALLLPARV